MKKLILGFLTSLFVIGLVGVGNATSITYQPGSEGIDAHVIDADTQRDANGGDYQYLTVNYGSGWPNSGLIKFDLNALTGTNILSANLSLYHLHNNVNGASIGLYRNLVDWNESTVTWNNAPAYNSTPVSILTISDSNDGVWRSWNITSIVQDWVLGVYDNYGLNVSRIDQANPQLYLLTSDYPNADYHPTLTIEYAPIPEPTTMLLLGTGLVGVVGAARRRKKNQA